MFLVKKQILQAQPKYKMSVKLIITAVLSNQCVKLYW